MQEAPDNEDLLDHRVLQDQFWILMVIMAGVQIWIWEKYLNLNLRLMVHTDSKGSDTKVYKFWKK